MINALNELCNEIFLYQIVCVPTHKDGNTLDLVFTNNLDLIQHVQALPSLQSTSHHRINILTKYKYNANSDSNGQPNTKFSYDTLNFFDDGVDWDCLRNELQNYDWNREFRDQSSDQMLTSFYAVTFETAAKYVRSRPISAVKKTSCVMQQ